MSLAESLLIFSCDYPLTASKKCWSKDVSYFYVASSLSSVRVFVLGIQSRPTYRVESALLAEVSHKLIAFLVFETFFWQFFFAILLTVSLLSKLFNFRQETNRIPNWCHCNSCPNPLERVVNIKKPFRYAQKHAWKPFGNSLFCVCVCVLVCFVSVSLFRCSVTPVWLTCTATWQRTTSDVTAICAPKTLCAVSDFRATSKSSTMFEIRNFHK